MNPGPLDDFRVRPYDPGTDEGFVLCNWTAEAASGPAYRDLDYSLCYPALLPHIRGLIQRLSHLISVVVPATSSEPLCAFSVLDTRMSVPLLWHLHVKGAFRSQGLMTGLLVYQGVQRGDHLVAATPTRDLYAINSKGLYHMTISPDLLVTV